MKIAVFDSGIGGITVLKELRKRFPTESFLYYGDTANVPYGTKSQTQIKSLASSAVRILQSKGVDALVIACNTASCVAIGEIREIMGKVPVFDVVEAGVTTVATSESASKGRPIAIFGTRATVRSHLYATSLKKVLGQDKQVVEIECPLLVPMIEEGWVDHPILHQTVAHYAQGVAGLEPGLALLACTHYPWIKAAFEKALPGWQVVDSAYAISQSMSHLISPTQGDGTQGPLDWHFTDFEAVPRFIYDLSETAIGPGPCISSRPAPSR